MSQPAPRISVFPKCYFDDLYSGRMDYLVWLRDAATLGAEGVEHYDGFFRSLDDSDVEPVRRTLAETGQVSSLLCFSPDFTHPDAAERARQIERQKTAIDLCVRLGIRHCRTLSGQRHPGLSRREGVARTVEGIKRSLDCAEKNGVVLCLENHYKDGTWQYPEFAQPEDIFLEIIGRIESPFFGVQYDPSNATVGGYDPLAFLEKVKHRVVSRSQSPNRILERFPIGWRTRPSRARSESSSGVSGPHRPLTPLEDSLRARLGPCATAGISAGDGSTYVGVKGHQDLRRM